MLKFIPNSSGLALKIIGQAGEGCNHLPFSALNKWQPIALNGQKTHITPKFGTKRFRSIWLQDQFWQLTGKFRVFDDQRFAGI